MKKSFLLTLLLMCLSTSALAESAYDRVMRTDTLRCGYNFYEPGFMKNENTGEFYGLYYELMEELGRISNIDIEWTALVDWGGIAADLNAKKVDAFCISVWPNALRAKHMILTQPFNYVTVESYARADDTRFDEELDAINNEDIRIAVLDNDIAEDIAKFDFPEATRVSAPALSSDSALLQMLVHNKADVTFTTNSIFLGFNRENPNKLKRVASDHPLRTFGTTIAIPKGDHDLKEFLNTAIVQMRQNGNVARILKKYEADYPNTFFQAREPF